MEYRRKIPKTLSGIETYRQGWECRGSDGRKIPKTLSGIETHNYLSIVRISHAEKYLKPYQGLKHQMEWLSFRHDGCAEKYLKPYQGLKRCVAEQRKDRRYSRKIPKTLSGIETTISFNPSPLNQEPKNT